MQLNKHTIHALFNLGCPNSPQSKALGLEFPLKKGWITKLIGKEIEQSEYDRLLALKGPRPKGVSTKEWRSGAIQPKLPKQKSTIPEIENYLGFS